MLTKQRKAFILNISKVIDVRWSSLGIYQERAKVFKAFCDPKRLAIREQLRDGEKCACVLQEPLDLTQSGLSYHMRILCDSGIVTSRQEGKWTHYRLSPSGRSYAIKLLKELTTPNSEKEDTCSF